MAIQIIKDGEEIERKDVYVVCPKCKCEFTCCNTDFEHGEIKCPNCANNIRYTETKTYTDETHYMKNLPKLKTAIKQEILENMDFDKIHDHMESVGWKWAGAKNGVPTTDEIKNMLVKLIDDAIDKKTTIATGGFKVQYREYEEDGDEPHTIGVDVLFYIEDIYADVNVDSGELVYY